MKIPLPRLLSSALLAGLLTWLIAWQPFSGKGPLETCFLELRAMASEPGALFIHIAEGHGVVELTPTEVGGGITKSDTPKLVRIKIPPGRIKLLAVDVFGPPKLLVQSAQLKMSDGRLLAELTDSLNPGQHATATATPAGIALQAQPPSGSFSFRLSPRDSILVPSGDEPWTVEIAGYFVLLTGLLIFVQTLLLRRLGEARRAWWRAQADQLRSIGRRRPVITLAAVALAASMISSYPVALGDKSFVSPNLYGALLYLNRPTLPGAPAEPLEDVKNADAAAIMLAHLPYSVLEAQALWRDHELPLWNRYSSGGLPLLGQGQSMFGDPLHLIPLMAGGAWWAWDLKFLLAKALFSLGIGLCVWSLRPRLVPAALLAASTAWIGFFAFRFNHPAIFSLCYAPWVLLPWLWVGRTETTARLLLLGGGLILADWSELTSGTAKEASMLLLGMNAAGLLTAGWPRADWQSRLRKLAWPLWASLCFLLLSAPHWLVFADALRHAATVYDIPRAYQLQPGLLLGFFDDIFTQDFSPLEQHIHPSLNFLVLVGVLWLAARWPRLRGQPAIAALALSAFAAMALVFGIIPPDWIIHIPLLANIQHIDNTFGCVAIILLLVLAGFGLGDCLSAMEPAAWKSAWKRAALLLAAICLLYLGFRQAQFLPLFSSVQIKAVWHSRFFAWYAPALVAAAAALPWGLRWSRQAGEWRCTGLATIAVCSLIVHFRHGMYLHTRFDDYVMNPRTGYDLIAKSPALERVRQRLTDPFRTCGFDYTLSPGYNAMVGLEGINGPDALANPFFRDLTNAAGVPTHYGWRLQIEARRLPELKPVLDFLNLRYYLREPDPTEPPPPLLAPVGQADMDVYESREAWPRAFFTDYVFHYRSLRELLDQVRLGDGRPFAAIQDEHPVPMPGYADRKIVPARSYRLTTNTTELSITAPGPGLLVLSENFEEANFAVTVNGAPARYLRANHTFKAVAVDRAGQYRVRFSYWPKMLTPALWLAAVGALLFFGSAVTIVTASRRRSR